MEENRFAANKKTASQCYDAVLGYKLFVDGRLPASVEGGPTCMAWDYTKM